MANNRTSNQCVNCGAETTNPRFCNRSCAAQYNNRRSPKRKPEGQCACGRPIPAGKRLCGECRQAEAARRSKEQENVRSVPARTGSAPEIALPRVFLSAVTVFETHLSGSIGSQFDETDSCGLFLDALTSLALSEPPYLRREDVNWVAGLIQELKSFPYRRLKWPDREWVVGQVQNDPLSELDRAIGEWVQDLCGRDHHPILSTLALAVAQFIESHACGAYGGRGGDHSWKIPALISWRDDRHRSRSHFGCLHDARLKKEVTQKIGHYRAAVRIPEGCRIVFGREREVLPEGTEFGFEIERCHLSSGFYDNVLFYAAESNPPKFDILEDLEFMGGVLVRSPDRPIVLSQEPEAVKDLLAPADDHFVGQVRMRVPVRWIMHLYDWSTDSSKLQTLPLPRWTTDGQL